VKLVKRYPSADSKIYCLDRRLSVLAALLWLATCALSAAAETQAAPVQATWSSLDVMSAGKTHKVSVRQPASVRLSADFALINQRLPVVLFLHGAGERGDDNELVRSVGLPIMVPEHDYILIVPQVPLDGWWSDPEMLELAMVALEKVLQSSAADRNRVYLTGLSMGGHGALQLAARYPDQFAAVLAICPRLGRPSYLQTIENLPANALELSQRLRYLPIWLFHGDEDQVVPVENSRKLAVALDRLGASSHYTEIPGVGHDIWWGVYSQSKVMTWLFSRDRRQKIDSPMK